MSEVSKTLLAVFVKMKNPMIMVIIKLAIIDKTSFLSCIRIRINETPATNPKLFLIQN